METIIYGLEAKHSYGAIRYVGRTAKSDPQKRLNGHVHAARKGITSPVYDWMRRLLAEGQSFRVVVLERTVDPDAEARWIADLTARGFQLFNARTGGRGGGSPDEETRRRLSKSIRETLARPEVRAKRQGEMSSRAKLTGAQVLEIRERWAQGGVSRKAIAEAYGIIPSHVKQIVQRKCWKHL